MTRDDLQTSTNNRKIAELTFLRTFRMSPWSAMLKSENNDR